MGEPRLGLVSQPGESETAFRERCQTAARQGAEQALAMEKVKFKPKFEALDMKLPDEKPAAKAGGSWLGWIFPAPQATESDDPKLDEKRRKAQDGLRIQGRGNRREVEAHRRRGDGDSGEAAQGGRACDALRAGLGAALGDDAGVLMRPLGRILAIRG